MGFEDAEAVSELVVSLGFGCQVGGAQDKKYLLIRRLFSLPATPVCPCSPTPLAVMYRCSTMPQYASYAGWLTRSKFMELIDIDL